MEYALKADMFYNRLKKRYKHIKKWAKRCGVYAYRLYDKDIPEIPVIVDLYTEHNTNHQFVVLTLYESASITNRNDTYLDSCKQVIYAALAVPETAIYTKLRKKQKGRNQYEKLTAIQKRIIVQEGACLFFINLSDYLDTGLFLDHRTTRLALAATAQNQTVLNLFCYTAAFSIHALAGGAAHVCSVDLSKNYLQWAKDNMRLNGFESLHKSEWVQSDVRLFLKDARTKGRTWDIVICDPPTFSNSKRTSECFDINRHWQYLIWDCCAVLAKKGVLYFSTNAHRFHFDATLLSEAQGEYPAESFMYRGNHFSVQDISRASIPEDFRNQKIHRLWKINKL